MGSTHICLANSALKGTAKTPAITDWKQSVANSMGGGSVRTVKTGLTYINNKLLTATSENERKMCTSVAKLTKQTEQKVGLGERLRDAKDWALGFGTAVAGDLAVGYVTPGLMAAEILGFELSSSESNVSAINNLKECLENQIKDKFVSNDEKFYQGALWGDVTAGAYGLLKLVGGLLTIASSVTIGAGAAGAEIGSGGILSLAVGAVAVVDVGVAVTGAVDATLGAGIVYSAVSGMGDHQEKLSELQEGDSGTEFDTDKLTRSQKKAIESAENTINDH